MSQPTEASATTLHCFAPCARGLERALSEEITRVGGQIDAVVNAGVMFSGDRAVAYAVNLHSRLASRVLMRVAQGRYRDDDDLYRLANRCEWERWFDVKRTLRIDINAIRSPLRSLNFATLRLKDGVVDRFRTRTGVRPSIDTTRPDVRIFGFLDERGATLYLDLSGEPLFKRGWRSERDDKGEAPLKENLAAGLLALCGWQPDTPLYDPFCGSGTIVIEAAQQALGIAPGIAREFGFQRLLDFDESAWSRLRADAQQTARKARDTAAGLSIAASDIDDSAIAQTERNAQRAGLPPGLLKLARCDFRDATPPSERPGMMLTNPPYGERLALRGPARRGSRIVTASSGDEAWRTIGDTLKQRFGGWSLWMLTSDLTLPARLGMKERRRTPLWNGALECRLFGFEIFAEGAVPRR